MFYFLFFDDRKRTPWSPSMRNRKQNIDLTGCGNAHCLIGRNIDHGVWEWVISDFCKIIASFCLDDNRLCGNLGWCRDGDCGLSSLFSQSIQWFWENDGIFLYHQYAALFCLCLDLLFCQYTNARLSSQCNDNLSCVVISYLFCCFSFFVCCRYASQPAI